MIGDRHHDIEAGVQVGTRSAGVLWGFGDHAELSGAGADVVLSSPSELLSLLLSDV
jgi:phosphoglycolate phosphatase